MSHLCFTVGHQIGILNENKGLSIFEHSMSTLLIFNIFPTYDIFVCICCITLAVGIGVGVAVGTVLVVVIIIVCVRRYKR